MRVGRNAQAAGNILYQYFASHVMSTRTSPCWNHVENVCNKTTWKKAPLRKRYPNVIDAENKKADSGIKRTKIKPSPKCAQPNPRSQQQETLISRLHRRHYTLFSTGPTNPTRTSFISIHTYPQPIVSYAQDRIPRSFRVCVFRYLLLLLLSSDVLPRLRKKGKLVRL
jgi:hypothetical protein